jgi:hypothetical protein
MAYVFETIGTFAVVHSMLDVNVAGDPRNVTAPMNASAPVVSLADWKAAPI